MGGDRELVMFAGLVAFSLIFSAQELRVTVIGLLLWLGTLFACRLMAKSDPKMRFVYLRHRKYKGNTGSSKLKGYYPPRSTHFRLNPNSQRGVAIFE